MTSAIERLETLLDEKDEEIEQLTAERDSIQRQLEYLPGGWRQEIELPKEQTLPVPRLELVLTQEDKFTRVWSYRIVRRHFTGEVLATPIGSITSRGGGSDSPYYTSGEFAGKLRLPMREGAHICHDMAHLNLPGFAVCGDHVDDLSVLAGKPRERW